MVSKTIILSESTGKLTQDISHIFKHFKPFLRVTVWGILKFLSFETLFIETDCLRGSWTIVAENPLTDKINKSNFLMSTGVKYYNN